MSHTVTTYTSYFHPWEPEQDEPVLDYVDTDTWTVDTLSEVADHMWRDGAWEPSESPAVSHRTWWSAETYEHPYTGGREEKSFHLSDEMPERLRAAVSRSLLARRDAHLRGDRQR